MKRKGEIAMLFNDLEDSQTECVVGGAQNGSNVTGSSIEVIAHAIGNDFAFTNTKTYSDTIGLPNGETLSFSFGVGFALSLGHPANS
jgi:hypothetical protein